MGDWIADERRRRGPSFSSALLEAISRATESSQDEFSLPSKPKLRFDNYAGAEHPSFKYNSINALQVRTGPSSSSAGDRQHCCCGSSSCKRRNASTSTSTSNPRPAYAWQEAEVIPKVKEPSPKLKPSKAVSPGSRLASILNSVLLSSWSKSKSQRQELKGVSDCSSNSTSLFARSMSSTSSSLHRPKSKDHYQHAATPSKRSSETPPSYHTKHKYSSPSTSSASYNKSSSTSSAAANKPSSSSISSSSASSNKYSSSSTSSVSANKSSSSSTSSASYNKYSSSFTSSASANKSSSSSTSSASYNKYSSSASYNKYSSSSTSSASSNKEKNGKIRRWMIFEKNVVASSLRNYSTKVDNSRSLDEEYADSDSSSDLFELNSIYSRDLPVYETTHLETNKAIARGLL